MRGTDAPSVERTSGDGLRRQLGLVDTAAIFVGIILGSGIFVAPAAVAEATHRAPAAAALWIMGGVVAVCGAWCYAECGARLPRTGGFYVFYRETYGEGLAFVGGWAALLVTYPASIAAIALVFASYLGQVVPATGGGARPAAVAVVAAGLLNALGLRIGVWAQRVLTGTKVAALAALCLAAVLVAPAGSPEVSSGPQAPVAWGAFLSALVVLLWTYDGWSDVTLVSGEIRDPSRNLWRAVALGTATLVVLYVAVQLAVGALLPAGRAASSEAVFSEAVRAGLGPRSGRLVAGLVVISTFGSINAIVLSASRLGFAMARDGAFFAWFGQVHPRWRTPARSVAVLVAACLLYVFLAGFRSLLEFFSFSVWLFYALTALAVLVLRRRGVGEPGAWRAPGGIAAPAVVLVTAAAMVSGLALQNPRGSGYGLLLLALGFPVWGLWRLARGRGVSR